MAGHSHWANIQRTKSKADARRGKIFSKWAKLIATAARHGGPDPEGNMRLRYAIERARAENMPKDSIERAIRKGTGAEGGAAFEEVLYEAFGPGGVALLVEALTDNRARTAPDLRRILERSGGSLGGAGSVAWLFERKASFALRRAGTSEEALLELALELGVDDVTTDEAEIFGIVADPSRYLTVKEALERAGHRLEDAALRYIPRTTVPVDGEAARRLQELLDALEDYDDVQAVHHNAEFPA